MTKNKNILLQTLNESYSAIKSNMRIFLIALGFDVVLVLLYGFVSSAYFNKMIEFSEAIGSVALSAQGVKNNIAPSFSSIFFNEATKGNFINLALLMLLYVISIYIIISVLLGISSYIAFNIKNFSKKDLVKFVKKIFLINIPWLIILTAYQTISFLFFFIDTSRTRLGISKTPFGYFDAVFSFLIVYIILISYILGRKKNFRNSMINGVKHFYPLFFYYIVLFVIIIFLGSFSRSIYNISTLGAMLYEIVIVLGGLLFLRVSFNLYYKKAAESCNEE